MRVRVLKNTSVPAAKPELTEGQEVDLPDEDALALVEAGSVEAVDEADVEKVKAQVEDRRVKAEERFKVSKESDEIAEKTAGRKPVDDKTTESDTTKPVDKPADDKTVASGSASVHDKGK